MPSPKSLFVFPVAEFAASLLVRQEVIPRAQVIADKVADLLPGIAVVVYAVTDPENPSWTPKATAGEIAAAGTLEFDAGTLGSVAQSGSIQVFQGADLQREE